MNDERLILEIFTPDQEIISKEVDYCTAPGFEGEFGVLPGHAPFFTKIKTGVIKFSENNKNYHFVISKGLSEVTEKKVTILTDKAISLDKIDLEKVEKEKQEAEDRLKGLNPDDKEYVKIKEDMDWALACMEALKEGVK